MKKFFIILALAIALQTITTASALAADFCKCGGTFNSISTKGACCDRPASENCEWMGPEGLCAGNGGFSNGGEVNLTNPLPGVTSVPILIGKVISAALGIVGSLALLMFIYGGFTWMLAAGNENAVTKGKNILTWAAIGLVVIFASYSLVNFIINALAK
jgi:hypothetical protein